MEEEFLPYEQALELRELGFEEPCFATKDQTDYLHINGTKKLPRGSMMYDTIDCPTFSQVFKWFREKYKLHSRVFFDGLKQLIKIEEERYNFDIVEQWTTGKDYFYYSYGFKHLHSSRGIYMSYKEAELECLNKLIEIVKEK